MTCHPSLSSSPLLHGRIITPCLPSCRLASGRSDSALSLPPGRRWHGPASRSSLSACLNQFVSPRATHSTSKSSQHVLVGLDTRDHCSAEGRLRPVGLPGPRACISDEERVEKVFIDCKSA